MKIVMLGIDLGKNLCSLAGLDQMGAVVLRRRLKQASSGSVHSPTDFTREPDCRGIGRGPRAQKYVRSRLALAPRSARYTRRSARLNTVHLGALFVSIRSAHVLATVSLGCTNP
jgi:hypothetical protein